jgi:hypothetical protein
MADTVEDIKGFLFGRKALEKAAGQGAPETKESKQNYDEMRRLAEEAAERALKPVPAEAKKSLSTPGKAAARKMVKK